MAGKRNPGPRGKLTLERQEQIVRAIAAGNYLKVAARSSGISEDTVQEWINRGEIEEEGIYHDFAKAIRDAEAEAEKAIVGEWQKQIPTNWQACATFLERRHPDRWGRRERREITGKDGGPIQTKQSVAIENLSIEELHQLETIMNKMEESGKGKEKETEDSV